MPKVKKIEQWQLDEPNADSKEGNILNVLDRMSEQEKENFFRRRAKQIVQTKYPKSAEILLNCMNNPNNNYGKVWEDEFMLAMDSIKRGNPSLDYDIADVTNAINKFLEHYRKTYYSESDVPLIAKNVLAEIAPGEKPGEKLVALTIEDFKIVDKQERDKEKDARVPVETKRNQDLIKELETDLLKRKKFMLDLREELLKMNKNKNNIDNKQLEKTANDLSILKLAVGEDDENYKTLRNYYEYLLRTIVKN